MSDSFAGVARRCLVAALPLLLGACEWFTDFRDQPRIEPWEPLVADTIPARGNPQLSVSIYGTSVAAFMVSLEPTPGAVDSMSGLQNPHPVTDSSLANGRRYYQINCAVCHGATGAGDGPALRYGVPAPSLLTPITRGRSDGYLFGIIRNGRGLMPNYARIEEPDRWDVVNYVRGLQGALGRDVSTEPAGTPGQNGPAVPGYTQMGPTRPPPFWSPSSGTPSQRRGTSGAAGAAADSIRPPADTVRQTTPRGAPR